MSEISVDWVTKRAFVDALMTAAVLRGWSKRPDSACMNTAQCDAISTAAATAVIEMLLQWSAD